MTRTYLLALALLLTAAPAIAGGDPSDGHSHGAEVDGASSSVGPGVVSTSAMTGRFEVVLKHAPVRGGEPYSGTLYLADFATNRPVAGATIELQAPGVPGEGFTVQATDEPGLYAVTREAGFPRDGLYDLTASVRAGDASDLVLLSGLYVGPVAAPAPAPAEPSGGGSFPWLYVLVVAALGAGLVALLLRSARQRRQAPSPDDPSPDPAPPARRPVPAAGVSGEPSLS